MDATDAGPEAAALREAKEEVGLDPDLVEIMGRLPQHETVTGFAVTPVLAWVAAPFSTTPEAGEAWRGEWRGGTDCGREGGGGGGGCGGRGGQVRARVGGSGWSGGG